MGTYTRLSVLGERDLSVFCIYGVYGWLGGHSEDMI